MPEIIREKPPNMVKYKTISFWALDWWQRELAENFEVGRAKRKLDNLLKQKAGRRRYRGAGAETKVRSSAAQSAE